MIVPKFTSEFLKCILFSEIRCFLFSVSISIDQLFACWKSKKTKLLKDASSKDNLDPFADLAHAILSWLGANDKLTYTYGTVFSWLVISNQPYIAKEDSAHEMKEEKNAALKTEYCKDCWKDLIDILITFLFDSTKCQRKSVLEGKLL